VPSANQKFYIQLQSSRLLVHFGQIQEIGHVIDKCLKTASVGIWRGRTVNLLIPTLRLR